MIQEINKKFIYKAINFQPDLIFIYRGTHILPGTLKKIREQLKAFIFAYNNDDPFSHKHPKYLWRHYLKSLRFCDWIFAYRRKNLYDYETLGFNNVSLLPPYCIMEHNYPIDKFPYKTYRYDVIFVGHYESDGREEYIKMLIDHNINCKLYGNAWECSKYYKLFSEKFGSIEPIYGDEYNLALNGAKIALVFLSKINNDTYTRRCFEIPATMTFMLSEYTDDLNEMFREGVEAEYFRSKEEMIDKIQYYLKHDDKREQIAQSGYKKLIKMRCEVTDRAKEIMDVFYRLSGLKPANKISL